MQDYKLSEIKNHDLHKEWDVNKADENVFLDRLQLALNEKNFAFKSCDSITLPYKCITRVWQYICDVFGVIYRDFATNRILMEPFVDEKSADEFLEKQKKLSESKDIDYDELQEVTKKFNEFAAKHRRGEHLTDLEVDEMLAAWERKVELEDRRNELNVSK